MKYHRQNSSQPSLLGHVLMGSYVPRNSLLHRTPLWIKSLGCIGLLLALAVTGWEFAVSIFLFLILIVARWGAKIPFCALKDTLYALRWIIILLGIYYIFWGTWQNAIDVICTIINAVVISQVLLSTTPLPVLLDGIVWMLNPLKFIGLPPERPALILALMLRSIPAIMDRWSILQMAAQARNLPLGSTWRLMPPLVVQTVDYAHKTGDALAARGLDDEYR